MKKLPLLFLLLSVSSASLRAQLFHRLDAPVVVDGAPLPDPWVGGLNAPQWSSADLDGDGKSDLYAFDRKAEVHLAFRNTGSAGEAQYEFAPHLAANFPACRNFVLLRDYNRDGAMDLFTHAQNLGIAGMLVFTGNMEGGLLAFTQVEFPEYFYNVIPVPTGGGFYTQLHVSVLDHPAVDDLDGDGDLDILSLESSGFSYVEHYQNMALEMGYTDDTLIFQREDGCWGKFKIPQGSPELILSPDPGECVLLLSGASVPSNRDGLHGGATLCPFDFDDDGDKDLLYGDYTYSPLILGKNGGDSEEAWMTEQDATFPSYDFPVDIPVMPAAFLLDLDNDGLKDLLASPNSTGSDPAIQPPPDMEVVWFYKNTGSNELPLFEFQQPDFLAEGMLDLGTGAQPTFADVDADGLTDIVAGNSFRWNPGPYDDPLLFFFKNTGTATGPAFELVDGNWLNFNQFKGSGGTWAFAPTFGDLDGDGDLDLLAGERRGGLFFAENTAGAGNPMAFGPIQPNWLGLDSIGEYTAPFIHDLNKDGLPDLLVGERSGNINFFPNTGSPGSPAFHPDPDEAPNNRFLGSISALQPPCTTVGLSAPAVLDFGDTTWIVTGTECGWLEAYLVNFDSLGGGAFELVSEKFGSFREGRGSRIAFANLNGDSFLNAVAGNHRGGLGLFSSPITVSGSVPAKEERLDFSFEIFPNPPKADGLLQVRLPETAAFGGEYRLFNALGQLVEAGRLEGESPALDVSGLQGGLWFLEIKIGEKLAVRRFLKK